MGNSNDQNMAFAQAFSQGAQHVAVGGDHAGGGLVTFSQEAWQAWDRAIQTFIDDIDTKINTTLPQLGSSYKGVGALISASDTRTLLQQTGPDEIGAGIKKYRDYLVELQKGIKTAYERLNKVDNS
jgi:hypothetical protein